MKAMCFWTVLIFSSCLVHLTCGVSFESASKYVKNLISTCQAKQGKFLAIYRKLLIFVHIYSGSVFHEVIFPPLPTTSVGDFMPAVIIWKPYLIYPQIIPPQSIKCIECGGSMYEAYWNNGGSASRQPKLLHSIVYLISAVYVCDNRHKLLSHDTVVLS